MLVYQAALSKPLDYLILASWKIHPCCPSCNVVPLLKSVEECWCMVLQPTRGGGLSACLRHESRRQPEAARTIHQCQVSASNPFICESFLHIPNVDTLHLLRGSQKCFAGVSHNRSLLKSMKITLLLYGIKFVEFSTSVDAF